MQLISWTFDGTTPPINVPMLEGGEFDRIRLSLTNGKA